MDIFLKLFFLGIYFKSAVFYHVERLTNGIHRNSCITTKRLTFWLRFAIRFCSSIFTTRSSVCFTFNCFSMISCNSAICNSGSFRGTSERACLSEIFSLKWLVVPLQATLKVLIYLQQLIVPCLNAEQAPLVLNHEALKDVHKHEPLQ